MIKYGGHLGFMCVFHHRFHNELLTWCLLNLLKRHFVYNCEPFIRKYLFFGPVLELIHCWRPSWIKKKLPKAARVAPSSFWFSVFFSTKINHKTLVVPYCKVLPIYRGYYMSDGFICYLLNELTEFISNELCRVAYEFSKRV